MEGTGTDSKVAAMANCYKGFDPAAYLQYNYKPPRANLDRKDSPVSWKMGCLHRAFTEGKCWHFMLNTNNNNIGFKQ